MFSTILSGALQGVKAYFVQVEVDVSSGLPTFQMVGYLRGEVREARERVQVALKNAGFHIPAMRITVNLSPADIKKGGTAFDLPIAVGILCALGYFDKEAVENTLFIGELGLDGDIKAVRGVLPIVKKAAAENIGQCIVPVSNGVEGAVIPGTMVRGVRTIGQLIQYLQASADDRDYIMPSVKIDSCALIGKEGEDDIPDFADVQGQEAARRAAEIAAAGFHNLLMSGPPGAGKSMIASRIPGIIPALTMEESLEISDIYSVLGMLGENQAIITRRPFQSPHHTITQSALIGGGAIPRPGMISLAHRGVLFLDELPEFGRHILDCMRQPLEEHKVHLAKGYGNVTYPADFMLVCAMNPCPCGHFPNLNRCICTETEVKRYLNKVSGPILDRIDICVELLPVKIRSLSSPHKEESSEIIRSRVMQARRIQKIRYQGTRYHFNGDIGAEDITKYCVLGESDQKLLNQACESLDFSARAYHRILKVARTIADLAGEVRIGKEHLTEAIGYRMMDNQCYNSHLRRRQ